MAKTKWIVKALTAEAFDNFAKADKWLCNFVRKNGYSITDFNIVRN